MPVSQRRAIPITAAVARQLARDRRGRAAQPRRDPPRRVPRRHPTRDLLALRHRQRAPAAPPLPRRHTTRLTDSVADRAGRSIERPADLADRLTLPPTL